MPNHLLAMRLWLRLWLWLWQLWLRLLLLLPGLFMCDLLALGSHDKLMIIISDPNTACFSGF